MSLVDHLTELRSRLIRAAAAVVVGFIICWIFRSKILEFLIRPYCNVVKPEALDEIGAAPEECGLLVTEPLEQLNVAITVATYGGLTLAIPVILWQVWRFVTPGLYPHEKRYAIPFVFSGVVLFASGVALGYWSLPNALEFLTNIAGLDFITVFSPAPYLKFVVKMMVAFGIGFQFPIVLIFLQLAGVVDTATLRSGRRYALVGIVILVALVTPSGDPITLLALSVPMYLFYEIAILFGVIRRRRADKKAKKRKEARAAKKNDAVADGERGEKGTAGLSSGNPDSE